MTEPSDLDTLRNEIRVRSLALRSIERITSMEEFGVAYDKASPAQRAEVIQLINGCNKDGLVRWLDIATRPDYDSLSLRELRIMGQRCGVPYYSRLSKAMLLSEITRYRRDGYGKEATSSPDGQG